MSVQMTLEGISSPSDGTLCHVDKCPWHAQWLFKYYGHMVVCCDDHLLDGATKAIEQVKEDAQTLRQILNPKDEEQGT